MAFSIEAEPIPLATDRDGVVRIGGTRVTLDTIVAAFQDGATPEEIVLQYPVLKLADIYAVVGYYLHRKDEVEDYLQERRQLAGRVQTENVSRFDQKGIRARLLARKTVEER